MRKDRTLTKTYNTLFEKIAKILDQARTKAFREINMAQVLAYWGIGREIIEFEQKGKIRAEYGKKALVRLSEDLSRKFGRGFSADNLQLMRRFYSTYQDKFQKSEMISNKSAVQQALSAKSKPMLSWSHYCELLKIEEALARSFYKKETIQNNWSIRELKRQINSMLFERLALSKNTKTVMKMAKKGQIIEKPEDAIKEPYILEFLNLKQEISYTENQLEQAIIDKLQYFLLELGKGFTFVARQKRITIINRHYHIDLVFYNRFLKCFVLIDLKTGELDHADIGQMNFYLNYFKKNEKAEDENDPIGLVLCAKKNDIFAKYILGELNNKVFASKYKLALPSEKELKVKLKELPLLENDTRKLKKRLNNARKRVEIKRKRHKKV
ncbi:MAG: PDDEXK nuclease domain-containing protein [Elusimicrobia bacterium]|nr:PDDEXK nuclease domain-containing protein [Elusimicrobiota bacterium]